MAEVTHVFVVAVLLLVLGSVVVYIIARVIRAIDRSVPELALDHSRLGRLTFELNLWEGTWEQDGVDLTYCMAGTREGPAPELLDALLRLLNELEPVRRAAVDYLLASQAEDPFMPQRQLAHDMFTLESLHLIRDKEPQSFDMEFALEGEPNGVWRVEFENGRPIFSGYED